MDYKHHLAEPNERKTSYDPTDTLNIVIKAENDRELVLGNIDLLNVVTKTNGDFCFVDPSTGYQTLIDSISISTSKGYNFPLYQYPARYEKMRTDASHSSDDMFNLDKMMELRSAHPYISQNLSNGTSLAGPVSALPPSSALRLPCALNEPIARRSLPMDKVGDITITLRLSQPLDVYYGNNTADNTTFAMSNVYLKYSTIPLQKNNDPVLLRAVYTIPSVIQSGSQVFNLTAPSQLVRVLVCLSLLVHIFEKRNIIINSWKL